MRGEGRGERGGGRVRRREGRGRERERERGRVAIVKEENIPSNHFSRALTVPNVGSGVVVQVFLFIDINNPEKIRGKEEKRVAIPMFFLDLCENLESLC